MFIHRLNHIGDSPRTLVHITCQWIRNFTLKCAVPITNDRMVLSNFKWQCAQVLPTRLCRERRLYGAAVLRAIHGSDLLCAFSLRSFARSSVPFALCKPLTPPLLAPAASHSHRTHTRTEELTSSCRSATVDPLAATVCGSLPHRPLPQTFRGYHFFGRFAAEPRLCVR